MAVISKLCMNRGFLDIDTLALVQRGNKIPCFFSNSRSILSDSYRTYYQGWHQNGIITSALDFQDRIKPGRKNSIGAICRVDRPIGSLHVRGIALSGPEVLVHGPLGPPIPPVAPGRLTRSRL